MMVLENSDSSLPLTHEGNILEIERITEDDNIKNRIIEKRLVPGVIIKIVKYAPLMDPMEIIVKRVHTSICVPKASRIIVNQLQSVSNEEGGLP